MLKYNDFYYTPATVDEYFEACEFMQDPKHSAFLAKKFTTASIGQKYRNLTYWQAQGVLEDERTDGVGWRKFSFVDIAFITLIEKLRELGLSLSDIKQVKDDLFKKVVFEEERFLETKPYPRRNRITGLEFAVIRSISLKNRGNTYLVVNSNGKTNFAAMDDIQLSESLIPEMYVFINLNKLLAKTFMNKLLEVHKERRFRLSHDEAEALSAIRSADDNDITLRRKDGKINIIEYDFSTDPSGELHNLIEDVGYGRITGGVIRDGKLERITIAKTVKVEND